MSAWIQWHPIPLKRMASLDTYEMRNEEKKAPEEFPPVKTCKDRRGPKLALLLEEETAAVGDPLPREIPFHLPSGSDIDKNEKDSHDRQQKRKLIRKVSSSRVVNYFFGKSADRDA